MAVQDVLNRDCFTDAKQSHYFMIARGFNVGRFDASNPTTVDGSYPKNGGMTNPARIHLAVGTRYFRFCDTKRANKDFMREAAGGWWVDYEVFGRMRDFAKRHAHIQDFAGRQGQSALSYAVKLHMAVPYEWGDSGVLVSALLTSRLDAYKGLGDIANVGGSDARDGGANYIPLQKKDIYQLYIPELFKHFGAAFTDVKRHQPGQALHSHQF
jgi:hypothetical protein